MLKVPANRLKAIMMCVLALVVVAAGVYVYRWSNTKPKCNCMFTESKRYGVIGRGGGCMLVECEKPAK